MTFQKILDKYRKSAFSERDKGNKFERLMQACFFLPETLRLMSFSRLVG
jgi:hypothetical protein